MPDVYVMQGGDVAQMAYDAISRVFTEEAAGLRILLKVNTGFKGPAASGLCTHPEVVRGLIRFFKERQVGELLVGDSSIVGVNSLEALRSAGIYQVCEEEGVACVDLDESGMEEREIPGGVMVQRLKMSRLPFQVDRLISVPVIKTHMYAGVTLSIKNMKGCLYQKDKTRLHRINQAPPDIHKGKCLDYGIMELTRVCYPDYVVTDGIVCMEGFGPSGGTPVNLGVVLASKDALSADLTAIRLMGMEYDAVPHLNLVREDRGLELGDIRVFPEDYLKWAHRFQLASEHDLHLHYPNPKVVEQGACSACHAAMVQFFRYHHQEYEDAPPVTIAFGADLRPEDLAEENVVLVGNCTAKFRDGKRPFCKGCPPVPSQIARTINAGETLDD